MQVRVGGFFVCMNSNLSSTIAILTTGARTDYTKLNDWVRGALRRTFKIPSIVAHPVIVQRSEMRCDGTEIISTILKSCHIINLMPPCHFNLIVTNGIVSEINSLGLVQSS